MNPEIVRPAGPIDPEIGILLIQPRGANIPTAGLTVFALHLDTVGGTQYSADYPSTLERELKASFGTGFRSLFGAGTCGDINHIDVTRRERVTSDQIGRTLANDVVKVAGNLHLVDDPALAVAVETTPLALQSVTDEEVRGARALLATLGSKPIPFLDVVKAAKTIDLADNYNGPMAQLEVQAIRLGSSVAIVALPGEVFVEHGLAIKKGSPFPTTLVIELANASPAYVPTRKAFTEGSYEIVNSRLAPGGGETLVETALRLLRRLDRAHL
jgi:hypothetical protein